MTRHRMLPVSRRRSPAQSGHRKTVWTTSQKATWKKKTAWWTRRNWTPLAKNTGISGQSWALLSRRWINVRHNAPVSGFPPRKIGHTPGVLLKTFSPGMEITSMWFLREFETLMKMKMSDNCMIMANFASFYRVGAPLRGWAKSTFFFKM